MTLFWNYIIIRYEFATPRHRCLENIFAGIYGGMGGIMIKLLSHLSVIFKSRPLALILDLLTAYVRACRSTCAALEFSVKRAQACSAPVHVC